MNKKDRSPRSFRLLLSNHAVVATACALLVACGSEDEDTGSSPASGGIGAFGTGGTVASGGAVPLGGTVASGGAAPLGGAPTGGIATSGGAATGGAGTTSGGTGGTVTPSQLIIEESETGFCSVDGIIESTNAGFTGSGYANTDNAMGAAVEWAIQVDTAGTYALEFAYASLGSRPATLLVNDTPAVASLEFADTGAWTTWSTVSTQITFATGEQRIKLQATDASGLANIDTLAVSGDSARALDCVSGTPPITIWIAGDSTVANGSTPCPTGWGAFFADYFNENVTVVNSAVGGRSVRTWLYDVASQMDGDGECILNTDASGNRIVQARWTDMLSEMSEGDYLFIQFGINDGDSTCPRHVGGEAFQEEYAMMAQAARDRGATPVFLTPVSMIRCSGDTPVGSRGFLSETFAVGTQEGVSVIDLHQLSVDLYTQLGFCPIPGGDVSADTTGPVGDFFCDDHTHFSDSGAEQIAEVVANAVADANLPLARYLK